MWMGVEWDMIYDIMSYNGYTDDLTIKNLVT